MIYPLVHELAGDRIDVAVACRVLGVPRSSYYDWRGRTASQRDVDDAYLIEEIRTIHAASRETYGAPRVHAELRLGRGRRLGRKRVARLMRLVGLVGVCHRRKRRGRPAAAVCDDLVARSFVADRPDRLWFTDITEHPTVEGRVYCCCVLDCYSRRVVGWAIADHVRSELVVDALQMARWNRSTASGTIVHSDRGSQGGFKWSSQHLDGGGVGWGLCGSGSARFSCIGGRCLRRAGRRSRGAVTGSGTGRRSRVG